MSRGEVFLFDRPRRAHHDIRSSFDASKDAKDAEKTAEKGAKDAEKGAEDAAKGAEKAGEDTAKAAEKEAEESVKKTEKEAEEMAKELTSGDLNSELHLALALADWMNFAALMLTFCAASYHVYAYNKFLEVQNQIDKEERDKHLHEESEG